MISKSIQCLCYGIGVRLDHIDLSHPIHLPVDYEYMQHDMSLQYILRDSWYVVLEFVILDNTYNRVISVLEFQEFKDFKD